MSKLVKDPLMLRLLLEALIVDDLQEKRATLDLSQVMHEVQNSEEIMEKANLRAEELQNPNADRSTQESQPEELDDDKLDFFGDGI